jgi:hypothetical protein
MNFVVFDKSGGLFESEKISVFFLLPFDNSGQWSFCSIYCFYKRPDKG